MSYRIILRPKELLPRFERMVFMYMPLLRNDMILTRSTIKSVYSEVISGT